MRKLTCFLFLTFALSIASHAQKSSDPNPSAKPKEYKPSVQSKKLNTSDLRRISGNPQRLTGKPQFMKYGDKIPGQYVVLLDEDFVNSFLKTVSRKSFTSRKQKAVEADKYASMARKKILKYATTTMGLSADDIINIYTGAIPGFSVKVPNTKSNGFLMKAKSKREVNAIMQDVEVSAASLSSAAPETIEYDLFSQEASWGKSLVGGCNCEKAKYWLWVLDTGIDMDHRDLNVVTEKKYAVSFVPGESVDDGHGHGTHSAGIMAAKNNSIGTVGIAAGAPVVPIKVLANSGGGSFAWVLAGLDHVALYAWRGDIANLNFTSTGYGPIDQAVKELGRRGIYVTMPAGNENKKVDNVSPARVNGDKIYTVSAIDNKYFVTGFSNFGNSVDFAAPGVGIKSTYKRNGYAALTGTSVAASHLAGAILAKRTCAGYGYYYKEVLKDKDSNKDKIVQVFK